MTTHIQSVTKRDGRVAPFDQNRITNVILKAMASSGEGDPEKDAPRVSDKAVEALNKKFPKGAIPHIEQVQDVVEESLILLDFPKTAKAYILYRNERARVREKEKMISEKARRLAAESKKYFRSALSEFIFYRTYSRWIESENRRETWIETVDRFVDFMRENLGGKLNEEEYGEVRQAILEQKTMPSMRLLWSAGQAAKTTNVSAYNCSYIAPSRLEDFAEIMYILMCGTGAGFSVESQNVQELPIVKRQTGKVLPAFVIEDNKEGWADALTHGLKTWYAGEDVTFDYSRLRPAGARLKTMGGRSSGPEPLRSLLDFTRKKILSRGGKRLKNIDVHDIICKIGDMVVMGGVRRSALISLSDLDDDEMRDAKTGQFFINEPQRSLANNSAVYNEKPTAAQFMEEWFALVKSGTGERGIFNRGGLEKQLPERRWKTFKHHLATCGTNPCLTGDTLVYTADGRGNVPIRELASAAKDVPVFCFNKGGGVVIRYLRHPRLTGKKMPVYKITLDDGSVIKATDSHKFRLKSGTYKEVKNLIKGDSLQTLTKFEASIKDLFPEANSRSQDYWWLNNGKASNKAEHRLIAEFHYNTKIPNSFVVHHKDGNAEHNEPSNLEILLKKEHDALHGDKNFSGVTDEELKIHALQLTKELGRRFSNKEWVNYAKARNLPQYFSKWRRDHLGGVLGIAKWAAAKLNFDHINADPRLVQSYNKYTAEGYNCEIKDEEVLIIKNCEVCGRKFRTTPFRREYSMCSISCGLKMKWRNENHRLRIINLIRSAHDKKKEITREKQTQIYSDLKFRLGREPSKKEWTEVCEENNISTEISRTSSPFRSYGELKEASANYNHKILSIEFCGYEDVYNGTVDEFHNFFVGGFLGKTKNNKKKFVYLNNLQCGEIVLRSKEFCNLSEVVARPEDTNDTLLEKVRIATILGTYQSTLTHFPYLSKEWKKNCEEERLLGVSLTGQWDCPALRSAEALKALREKAIEVNQEYAKRFGINPSTCITCVKPSGTLSQLVDSSSGMHPRHARYYIRRVRISASDPLFQMLKEEKFQYYPEVGQVTDSASTYVLEFPVKAPEETIVKNDLSALEQLEHWKMVKENYTEHNPSVTVSVGENEWIASANWLYEHWDILGGLSFLPRSDYVYKLAPYEEISKGQYEEMVSKMPPIDFSHIMIYEKEDNTQGAKELACVGGVCEIDLTNEVSSSPVSEPAEAVSASAQI